MEEGYRPSGLAEERKTLKIKRRDIFTKSQGKWKIWLCQQESAVKIGKVPQWSVEPNQRRKWTQKQRKSREE